MYYIHLVEYSIIVIKPIELVTHCPLAEALLLQNSWFLLAGLSMMLVLSTQHGTRLLLVPLNRLNTPQRGTGHWQGAVGSACVHSHGMFVMGKGRFPLWGRFWMKGERKGLCFFWFYLEKVRSYTGGTETLTLKHIIDMYFPKKYVQPKSNPPDLNP